LEGTEKPLKPTASVLISWIKKLRRCANQLHCFVISAGRGPQSYGPNICMTKSTLNQLQCRCLETARKQASKSLLNSHCAGRLLAGVESMSSCVGRRRAVMTTITLLTSIGQSSNRKMSSAHCCLVIDTFTAFAHIF
jgi:hypothetical protein